MTYQSSSCQSPHLNRAGYLALGVAWLFGSLLFFPLPSKAALLSETTFNDGARVGFLIGTFDPFHLGHEALAASAQREAVDVVIVIPTQETPWLLSYKPNASSFESRREMLRAGYRNHSFIIVPDIPYSAATPLQHQVLQFVQRKTLRTARTFAIIGADVAEGFAEIPPELFLKTDGVVVVGRPGHDKTIPKTLRDLPVTAIESTAVDLSSSAVRTWLIQHPEFFLNPFAERHDLPRLQREILKFIHSRCLYCMPCVRTARHTQI